MSPKKSQQYGQSATHDGTFLYSLAMSIAAISMVIRNIKLIILGHILQENLLNGHHYAANRLKIGK